MTLPGRDVSVIPLEHMWRSRRGAVAGVALWLLASAVPVMGQLPQEQPQPTTPAKPPEPPPRPVTPEVEPPVEAPREARPTPSPEEVVAPTLGLAPPTFVGPDLFNPPPHRGWITLTPSLSILGGYNDNLFLSTRGNETEDFLVGFVPGLTLSMQRPEYQLLAGYFFSAEYYAEHSELNKTFDNQVGFLDGYYQLSPRLRVSLNDSYVRGRDTTRVTLGGISAGRQDSWRNTVVPRLRYQATPLTRLNVRALYSMLRFEGGGNARDSDSYRLGVGVEHQFTPRFLGRAEMDVAYFDAEDEPAATTYTPRFGFDYQLTPTLSLLVDGGPSMIDREGEPARITPSGRIELVQLFRIGSLKVGYDRALTAETVGIRDRQLAFATLRLTTLLRGLDLEITPRYSRTDRDIEGGSDKIEALTVNLSARRQVGPRLALTGSYTFFAQRETSVEDIDQNRVFLGIQYAYPINFE